MSMTRGLPQPWADLDWRRAGFELADLSWWGGDHELWRATDSTGTALLAKLPRPHLSNGRGAVARRSAGDLGIGPEVLYADPADGTTIEVELDSDWRVATLWRVNGLDAVRRLGSLRAAFREGSSELSPRDPGADAARLIEGFGRCDHLTVEESILAAVPRLREAVDRGAAPVPCWLSAEISDVLVHAGGRMLLTGGTSAGSADPLADVGSLLTELSPLVADAEETFLALWGQPDPVAYARARVWGVLADLRDYLWAERALALDPESRLSYGGYRLRKLWRIRLPFVSGELDELLRVASRRVVRS